MFLQLFDWSAIRFLSLSLKYIYSKCFGTVAHFSTCNFYNANINFFSLYSLKETLHCFAQYVQMG